MRGLRQLDLARVASEVNRDISKDIQAGAQQRLMSQPVPKNRGVIGRRASATSASVSIRYSRYPWAAGAEWGAKRWAQFRPWVGNKYTRRSTPGYMVGATLKEELPAVERTYRRRILNAVDKATR